MKLSNYWIPAVLIITLIIVIAGSYYFWNYDEKITALEGLDIANNAAKEWNQNASLVSMGSIAELNADGRTNSWVYSYLVNIDGNLWECRIVVNNDLSIEQNMFQSTGLIDFPPLANLSLDSTVAMEIALENETINNFIDAYGNCLAGMGVSMKDTVFDGWTNTSYPIWKIAWDYQSFNENYHRANIFINGNTGEILYVEADN